MAVRRLAVSIPEELMEEIKEAAGGEPVSGWAAEVLAAHLDEETNEQIWASFVAESETRMTAEDRERYEEVLKRDDERHHHAIREQ